jgi:hypothetical protein
MVEIRESAELIDNRIDNQTGIGAATRASIRWIRTHARRRGGSRFNYLRALQSFDIARGTVPALLPLRRRGDETDAGERRGAMKIIHGSLSALLTEVKEQGKVDGVRVAAMMQSTFEGAGTPRYTSWVIV